MKLTLMRCVTWGTPVPNFFEMWNTVYIDKTCWNQTTEYDLPKWLKPSFLFQPALEKNHRN